ncbi:MAG: ABC transporter ATP-binding protein [Firmicutes bacterium]|nr:ABC transporter ATP-binding protein [Bacillota bacterium]MCL5038224.1 ABC transporter ATP-binding protein [Bacillota bacterium]
MNLLEIKNLKIVYRTQAGEARAVDGIDLNLTAGKNLGLVGESGCGKSTVVRSILRLLPPNARIESGRISFDGKDLSKLPERELESLRWQEISLIPQGAMNSLDPVYRVGDQIVEAILAHEKASRPEVWARVEKLFDLVGLAPFRLRDFPHQYSGGMKQRAFIAMALALHPKLIIADEPTTALDVIVQGQILRRIKEIHQLQGGSMILVTHDISVVAETCHEVAIMYAGKIMEFGRVEEIFQEPAHPYTMGLKNAFPSVTGERRRLISIPGKPPDLINSSPGCLFAPRCPFATSLCFREMPAEQEIAPGHLAACHHLDRREELRVRAQKEDTWGEERPVSHSS